MHSFLYKVTMVNDIIRFHEIFITHTKLPNKLHNLLVLIICPWIESRIRILHKDANYIVKVLGINGSDTRKALIIYQGYITEIYDILPRMILEFDTLRVNKSLHQVIIIIGDNGSHGGNIDLGYSFCRRHQ